MLRNAFFYIHKDPHWWIKILIGGALTLTIIGYPLSVGFVTESMDNSRKGYPTPLPRWRDWSSRYLLGVMTILIDLVFFGFPLIIASILTFCISISLILALPHNTQALQTAIITIVISAGVALSIIFLGSIAPVSRLIYIQEGRIEDAVSILPLRDALDPHKRMLLFRTRLLSLTGYIPVLLSGGSIFLIIQSTFPGNIHLALLHLWLTCSTLLYAHLLVGQLYIAVEKEIIREQMQRWDHSQV